MKKLFTFMIISGMALSACKKGGKEPTLEPSPKPTVEIGGQKYPIIKIGGQTWTAESYNGSGGENYFIVDKSPANEGKLYTMAEAKSVALPEGWRLPSKEDLEKLMVAVGGSKNNLGTMELNEEGSKKLMSASGWNFTAGVNTLSFNALPTGYYNTLTKGCSGKGTFAGFWSSSPALVGTMGYTMIISQTKDTSSGRIEASRPTDKYSLRFVKDN